MSKYFKNKDRYYKMYKINYLYKNGFRGEQTILSSCDSLEQLTNIINKQLFGAKRARFKALTYKKNNKGKLTPKVVDGWLLNIDIRSFSIEQ